MQDGFANRCAELERLLASTKEDKASIQDCLECQRSELDSQLTIAREDKALLQASLEHRCNELEQQLVSAKEDKASMQACLEHRCAEFETELASAREEKASMQALMQAAAEKACKPEADGVLAQRCSDLEEELRGVCEELSAAKATFVSAAALDVEARQLGKFDCDTAQTAAVSSARAAPVAPRVAQVARSSSRREQQMRRLVATMHNNCCKGDRASSAPRVRRRAASAAAGRMSERRRQQSERLLEVLHAREAGRGEAGEHAGWGQRQQLEALQPPGDAQPKELVEESKASGGELAEGQQSAPALSKAALEEENLALRRALQSSRQDRQQLRRAARGFVERFQVRCR